MKTLYRQLKPYTHAKPIEAYERFEVESYHFCKNQYNELACLYTLPNGRTLREENIFESADKVKGIDVTDLEVLPYYADVIQDLPTGMRFEPITYVGAQLMVERKGSYQYYKHESSEDLLLIAMNSNIVSRYLT